jgi:Bacteriocin-protection, YdeI or OmpD-Associated
MRRHVQAEESESGDAPQHEGRAAAEHDDHALGASLIACYGPVQVREPDHPFAHGHRTPQAKLEQDVQQTQPSLIDPRDHARWLPGGRSVTHRFRSEWPYHGPVSGQRVPGGVVHELPADLRKALVANATALDAWKDITPLARNEFICWVEDAKQQTTRERRIRRTREELEEGLRRPCCWPGCKHRERTGR